MDINQETLALITSQKTKHGLHKNKLATNPEASGE